MPNKRAANMMPSPTVPEKRGRRNTAPPDQPLSSLIEEVARLPAATTITAVREPVPISLRSYGSLATNSTPPTSTTSTSALASIPTCSNSTPSELPTPTVTPAESLLPSVREQIPLFVPEKNRIEQWISRVDALAKIYSWTDRTTSHFALSRLGGVAKTWYEARTDVEKSWQDWKILLISTFKRNLSLHDELLQILGFKHRADSPYFQYVYKKLAMLQMLPINFTDAQLVEMICGGLPDGPRDLARTRQPKTVADLAQYLQDLDRTHRIQSVLSRPTGTTIGKTETTCFYCGRTGHTKDECKQRIKHIGRDVKCRKCGRSNHLEAACRAREISPQQQQQSAQPTSTMKLQNENTQLKPKPAYGNTPGPKKRVNAIGYEGASSQGGYKEITIKGKVYTAYIDPGSECSLITRGLAMNIDGAVIRQLDFPVELALIAGLSVEVEESCSLEIQIDNLRTKTDFLIVESCTDVDVLLGRDVINQPNFSYKIENGKMSFLNKETIEYSVGNISESEFGALQQILTNSKSAKGGIGQTSTVKMQIRLTDNTPIASRPYRMSEKDKEIVRQTVTQLLEEGIIRESSSPYASPVLLADKKTGEKRMCVDFRRLNKITIKEHYPLPLIEELLTRVNGYKYFTALDLASGYHQIRMAEDAIEKTAFLTGEGQYEYLRLPFGLCNAPSTFQRLMDKVLGPLRFSKVLVYLDDILIPSKTVEEGLAVLKEVLQRLDKHGLTLKLKKCYFLRTEIEYLGHTITEEGIQPGQRKTLAVRTFPTPSNVHTLRQFLGLTGFFRKFILNYAAITSPLTKLLKKGAPWIWTTEHQQATEKLRALLISKPILKNFEPTADTEIHTDASQIGIAGILMQQQNGKLVAISYFSRQTSMHEKNYHSFELETLAVIESISQFKYYLYDRRFKVFTDCSAVKHTFQKKDMSPRVARWVLRVQEFDFEICHRAGTAMQHVDALSRNPPTITKKVCAIGIAESDWRVAVQHNNPEIREIIRRYEQNNGRIQSQSGNYVLHNNLLCRRTTRGLKWVVPKECQWQIVLRNHDEVGHPGADRTYERVARQCWFPKMKRYIQKYVSACIPCLYFKIESGKKSGLLHPIRKHARPFHTVHLDHFGPLDETRSGNRYLLVIVDAFTKFLWIKPVKGRTAKETVRAFEEIIGIVGAPMRCITDKGSAFSSEFSVFCKSLGIHHHTIAIGMPRGNGQVEIYLKELKKAFGTTTYKEWEDAVPTIQIGLNNHVSASTGVTPTQALLGYNATYNASFQNPDEQLVDVTRVRQDMVNRIEQAQKRQKDQFDKMRKVPREYEIGDLVLVKRSSIVTTGESRKFKPRFKGPFKVVEKLFGNRYKVQNITGRKYEGVYAVEDIKPWIVFCAD